MDIERIEQGIGKVDNLFTCMFQTTLSEDETIGRKEQYFFNPGAFLLSEVLTANEAYHTVLDRKLTTIEMKNGSTFEIETPYRDFLIIWSAWLEQQG